MPDIDIHMEDGLGNVECNKRIVICGSSRLAESVATVAGEYKDVAEVLSPNYQGDQPSDRAVEIWLRAISTADEVVTVLDESCSIGEHVRAELVWAAKCGVPISLRIIGAERGDNKAAGN